MKIQNPRALLIVGIAAISMIGWILMVTTPMPDALSSPHHRVSELSSQGSCQQCHSETGLAEGCLHCHSEIQSQLTTGKGYHAHLLKGRDLTCAGCHKEHSGTDFQLVNLSSWGAQVPRAFKHPHVEFQLEGKHSYLECEECHQAERREVFTLPGFKSSPRMKSFLGLDQDCRTCHADGHSGGLTPECGKCHGQESFEPPVHFDHAKHFALVGGHEGLACKSCHKIPDITANVAAQRKDFPFPFDEVRGKVCVECHQKPHHAASLQRCEDCHWESAPHWESALQNVSAEQHMATGFRLLGAHSQVECAKCHPRDLAFEDRYQDPQAPGYLRTEDTCQGCHKDAHKGQFQERHSQCLDCHSRNHFRPTIFGHSAHTEKYPLTGAHAAVACVACHKIDTATGVRQFVGTTHVCKDCHAYPHGAQFQAEIAKADCTTCHLGTAESFLIRPFDHATRTAYPLIGAHANAQCNDCHVEFQEGSAQIRKFRGNPQECDGCHRDIHRGQFQKDGTLCSACHPSFDTWSKLSFDHNTMSRFALEGVHASVACSRCHLSVKVPDGAEIIQYKPLGVECRDCHEIIPGSNPTTVR